MKSTIIRYKCPHCGSVYDTEYDAEECEKECLCDRFSEDIIEVAEVIDDEEEDEELSRALLDNAAKHRNQCVLDKRWVKTIDKPIR
ncbi:MAG: hypothetical protein U9R08_03520 [Nanoarchaeota archaeon]|nr:hypothetical protein [Nanoarchaeota archaeon]